MKRAIKRLLVLAVFVLTFGLAGCGATLTTDLTVSDNFAGSRTMEVSIDKDTFDEYAPIGSFATLASEIRENVPQCMVFNYEEKDGQYVFHFVMSFTSKEDYEAQVSSVLGKKHEIEFVYSKSPFTKGISLQEDFTSEELLAWFKDYLVSTEYLDEDDAPFVFSTVKNNAYINGTKYECNKSFISVSQKTYIPIEEMNIFTDIDVENEKIARKIELVFADYIIKANREVVEEYLNLVTPGGCAGEWQVIDDYEKFVLVIPSCSEEEMTVAMKTFCNSEISDVKMVLVAEEEQQPSEEEKISYSEMWDEQVLGNLETTKKIDSKKYVQPFGFETTIVENLDLSAFACDSWGEIESSYYISAKNGKPESMIYYPNDEESYGWDYIDEKHPEYYYVETAWMPRYQIVSNVDKYFVPSSVLMNTTIKSSDKMVREFVFEFDKQFDKNVLKKIEQKSDMLFEEHKELIDVSMKNRKKNTSITWKISGDIEEVDAFCEEVFGMGYSNVSYYCQDRFVLNRQYDYKEVIDFRPIFDWEYSGNVDYTLKMTGKVNKESTAVTGGLGAAASIGGKKVNYLSTESGYLDARVTGTTVNRVLAYLINLLVLNGVRTVFAVFVLVCNKRPKKALKVKKK